MPLTKKTWSEFQIIVIILSCLTHNLLSHKTLVTNLEIYHRHASKVPKLLDRFSVRLAAYCMKNAQSRLHYNSPDLVPLSCDSRVME